MRRQDAFFLCIANPPLVGNFPIASLEQVFNIPVASFTNIHYTYPRSFPVANP